MWETSIGRRLAWEPETSPNQPQDPLSSLEEARNCRGGLGFSAFISYSCLKTLFKIQIIIYIYIFIYIKYIKRN